MLLLTLDVDDLAAARFAISPMEELVASLQRRARPGLHPATAPWEASLDGRLDRLDRELLDALTGPANWVPDFLSPFPDGPEADFAAELAAVRATGPARVRADLEEAHRGAPLPDVLRRDLRRPDRLLAAIADVVEAYWEAAIAPWWPRMRAVLEADIAYRAQRLVTEGLAALFGDLHPRIAWEGGVLRVDVAPQLDHAVDVAGRRLPLVPCIFARRPLVNISATLPPVLAYPARGAAVVWDDAAPARAELAELLGRGRANVLAALEAPGATVDLARLLGLTPSAVSQHLGVLARAGLVAGTRQGRRVLYRRTDLGERLCASTGAPDHASARRSSS